MIELDCLIYPFSRSDIALAKSIRAYDSELDIKKYVCPATWKASFDDTDEFQVETDFAAALDEVEAVIICDSRNYEWLYTDILAKIKTAVQKGKTVRCCTELKAADLDEIKAMPEYDENRFRYLADYPDPDYIEYNSLQNQDCVVIGIGKMLRGIDYNSTFYYLINKYRSMGYSVVGVGSDHNCRLLGCSIFPDSIFSFGGKEEEKVLMINSYINDLQLRASADVLIVQLPDGMMSYSNDLHEGFGIKPFITVQALGVDYFIFNVPVDEFDKDSFMSLSRDFVCRYGFAIDAIGMDNKLVELSDSLELDYIRYRNINPDDVSKAIHMCNEEVKDIIFFSPQNENEYDRIVSDSIEKLTENIEVL